MLGSRDIRDARMSGRRIGSRMCLGEVGDAARKLGEVRRFGVGV